MRDVGKVLEICTWTMMISTLALEHANGKWDVCTPVSIEHGFDVLTPEGRRHGEEYIHRERPDLVVGEWMCGPFSSLIHVSMGKSDELKEKILREQRDHAKVSAWIARISVGSEQSTRDTGSENNPTDADLGDWHVYKRCSVRNTTHLLTCVQKTPRILTTSFLTEGEPSSTILRISWTTS